MAKFVLTPNDFEMVWHCQRVYAFRKRCSILKPHKKKHGCGMLYRTNLTEKQFVAFCQQFETEIQ